jgi:ABC-type methionine transport system ATPase subunit
MVIFDMGGRIFQRNKMMQLLDAASRLCPKMAILKEGKIIESGDIRQLLYHPHASVYPATDASLQLSRLRRIHFVLR